MHKASGGYGSCIETDGGDVSTDDMQQLFLATNDEFKKYVHLMPHEFKEEYFDGVVIFSANDFEKAKQFSNHLSNDIQFRFGKDFINPKIILAEGIHGNHCETLTKILQRSSYAFLFLTKSFCEEGWSELISDALMVQSIESKRGSVVHVHTEEKKERSYELPSILLSGIKPIEYFNIDQLYKESLSTMFSIKADVRIKRDTEMDVKRRDYFKQNKDLLIEMANQQTNENSNMILQRTHTIEADRPVNRTVHKNPYSNTNRPVNRTVHNNSCSNTNIAYSCNYLDINSGINECCTSSLDASMDAQFDSGDALSINETSNFCFTPQTEDRDCNYSNSCNFSAQSNMIGKPVDFSNCSLKKARPKPVVHNSYYIHQAENVIIGSKGKIYYNKGGDGQDDSSSESTPQSDEDSDFNFSNSCKISTPSNRIGRSVGSSIQPSRSSTVQIPSHINNHGQIHNMKEGYEGEDSSSEYDNTRYPSMEDIDICRPPTLKHGGQGLAHSMSSYQDSIRRGLPDKSNPVPLSKTRTTSENTSATAANRTENKIPIYSLFDADETRCSYTNRYDN